MGKEDVNKGEINVRNGGQSLIVKKKGKASVKQINTTIINNNDNTTTNSTKPKKASLKTVLILIASVFIIFLIANIIYKTNMSNANYSKNNGEYLQAAKYYHDALAIPKVLIFSKISSEEVECMEADCYFLRALKEKDDDIARKYYARAGGIYGKIINNEKSKGTKVYIEALAGLSHVYQYSGHAIDEKWKKLINILENEAQKFNKTILNNKEDINTAEIPIYHWAKVYSAIGDFYYTLIQRDYAFMTDPNIVHSALVSYENYDKLINLAKKDEEVANLLNDDSMYYDMIKAELMILIARSPYTKDPDQYATQAIELCQSYLKDASTKGIESEESISLKAFIADGYRVLGEYYSDNEEVSKEYMKKAYDELKKFYLS